MKLEDLKKIREKSEKDMLLRAGKTRLQVVVGMGTSGIAAGARETLKVLLDEVEKRDLRDVIVTQAGERGLSSHEPIVTVMRGGQAVGGLRQCQRRDRPQDRGRAPGQRQSRYPNSSSKSRNKARAS